MSEPVKFEFKYRRPGNKDHENLTHVLDEIIIKLGDIEKRLSELEQRTSWQ